MVKGVRKSKRSQKLNLRVTVYISQQHYTQHKKKRLDKVVTPLPSGVTRSKSGQVRFQGF